MVQFVYKRKDFFHFSHSGPSYRGNENVRLYVVFFNTDRGLESRP